MHLLTAEALLVLRSRGHDKGVLRHNTEMEVDRSCVDSHGQSEIAFAFCRLLGFTLLPRLKAIGAQRLYRPASSTNSDYPNLVHVLTRPIDWQLIEQQYDEMVRYTTALAERTADDPEAILRRFTRGNPQHPTYRATLAELGKAVKTIFICRYLDSEALRREVYINTLMLQRVLAEPGWCCVKKTH